MTKALKLSTLAICLIFAVALTFNGVAAAFTGSGAGTSSHSKL